LAAILGGTLWGAIPGWLRARRGSHEVINTIMLNFVAAGLSSYVALYLLKNPDSQNPETRPIGAGYLIHKFEVFGGAPVSLALPLAFVGLSQMVPMILCTIPAGHFADTFNRKTIILASTLVLALASLGLTLASAFLGNVAWIYFFLVIIGAARTFLWPASAAFVTGLVPREIFARAVTFNSGAFQFSSVLGPVAFGTVIALTPHADAGLQVVEVGRAVHHVRGHPDDARVVARPGLVQPGTLVGLRGGHQPLAATGV